MSLRAAPATGAWTRGPWHTDGGPGVFDAEGRVVADCSSVSFADATVNANARLIAAAPQLYEALKEATILVRNLDQAISHMIAVKGSAGLSPWAMSVLHDAIARQAEARR